jgi:hypothetical protein
MHFGVPHARLYIVVWKITHKLIYCKLKKFLPGCGENINKSRGNNKNFQILSEYQTIRKYYSN